MAEKKLVMVTNDDSVQSNGIIELARAVASHAEVEVVAPEQPMSATALSLTFHKPLRVSRVERGEFGCYAVSGSPGDCVMIGVNRILRRRPDLVVSGINIGDNDTLQDVLASGTVAAAIEAALMGIPAIAFSMVVNDEALFALEYNQPDFREAARFAGAITAEVLANGMPKGAEVLNVNFPSKIDRRTEIAITEVGKRKYTERVTARKDPRGRPYYWLFGETLRKFAPTSDAQAVLNEGKVSISPVELNLSGKSTPSLASLRDRVEQRVRTAGR